MPRIDITITANDVIVACTSERDPGINYHQLKYILNAIYSTLPPKTKVTLNYQFPILRIRPPLHLQRQSIIHAIEKCDTHLSIPVGRYQRGSFSSGSSGTLKRTWEWSNDADKIMANLNRGNWQHDTTSIFQTIPDYIR